MSYKSKIEFDAEQNSAIRGYFYALVDEPSAEQKAESEFAIPSIMLGFRKNFFFPNRTQLKQIVHDLTHKIEASLWFSNTEWQIRHLVNSGIEIYVHTEGMPEAYSEYVWLTRKQRNELVAYINTFIALFLDTYTVNTPNDQNPI